MIFQLAKVKQKAGIGRLERTAGQRPPLGTSGPLNTLRPSRSHRPGRTRSALRTGRTGVALGALRALGAAQ